MERTAGNFWECKLLGHAWDSFTPVGWNGIFRDVIHLRCVRCGTERHDSIDSRGELAQRTYTYPDGYRDAKDERPTRAQMRLTYSRRSRHKRSK